ncbi:IclR family transcriptional regulator [Alteribacillus sp. JSM 102045]|uniref:IclR family transcriptional regulator n=1 Tax=Alteribacillus sp. JSM 102045 TaxID=1562101 RepID=UPI0035C0AE51
MAEKKNAQVQSLLVGFSIVELIAERDTPMKFNDIHNETKITKSNLYKYLNTLTSLGILHRDPDNGMYTLGSTLVQYGMAAVNKEDVVNRASSFLQEINLKSKETTLLAVWTHTGPMIVKMIHSSLGLNLGGQVGTILPINSAAGKLFAAFMNDPIANTWKEKEQSDMNVEQKESFNKELEIIKQKKIAFAKEALAPSVASTAVPIFNYNEELLGGVIVVGFEKSIPQSTEEELSQYLLKKSQEISLAFGGKM